MQMADRRGKTRRSPRVAHAAMHPAAERIPPAISAKRQRGSLSAAEFAAPDQPKKSRAATAAKHMRQGGASGCRHVAPALLLC